MAEITIDANLDFLPSRAPWNTWATIHDSVGDRLFTTLPWAGFEMNGLSQYAIYRHLFGYDTTSLAGVVINTVYFKLYVTQNMNDYETELDIIKTTYNYLDSDYELNEPYAAPCGNLTRAEIVSGGINRYYQKLLSDNTVIIKGGTTKIALRSSNDNDDIDPLSGASRPCLMFQDIGDANKPQLVINYTAPASLNQALIID